MSTFQLTNAPPSILCPFRVVVDTREQSAFRFEGFKGDSKQKYRPLFIETVPAALFAGDYSIEGWEDQIAIERKSKDDFYSTFISDRDRGEEQLRKLDYLQKAFVVIEASMEDVLRGPDRDMEDDNRRKQRKSMFRSLIAWQQRRPKIHWQFMPSRQLAELYTFRSLERFYQDVTSGKQVIERGE